MSHHHLTPSERVEIYKLFTQEKCSQAEIARRLDRHPSSISRELRRKATEEGWYFPDIAHKKAKERRQNAQDKFQKVSEETIEEIRQGFQPYHSPEQIVGRRKREEKETHCSTNSSKSPQRLLRRSNRRNRKRHKPQEIENIRIIPIPIG